MTRFAVWLFLTVTIAVSVACTPTLTAIPSESTVIVNGTLFDGTGTPPTPQALVAFRDGKIVAVGRQSAFSVPPTATLIDAHGGTIMPGVINSHVHFVADPDTRRRYLLTGVTTVCDMGTSPHCMPLFARDQTRHHDPIARGFMAGPMLTAPGGYPSTISPNQWALAVRNPEEGRTAVRELATQGVNYIKIALEPGDPTRPWPVMDQPTVAAIVAEAHAHNLPVRAHLRYSPLLDTAIIAEVDALEHVPLPFAYEYGIQEAIDTNKLHLTDYPDLQEKMTWLATHGVILVPTLETYELVSYEFACLTEAEAQQAMGLLEEIVGYYHDQGGVVAVGTDYGVPGIQLGMPIREMQLLHKAGLSPSEVLVAATQNSAHACNQSDTLGTLEVGKAADLLVVANDPLSDVTTLLDLSLIVKDGVVIQADN